MSVENEPVVFSSAIEGTMKAFGDRLTPALLADLKAAGMDFKHPQPAYHLETWLKGIKLIAAVIAKDLPESERYRSLGREFMRGYVQTAIGFATLTTARLIGIRRTLLRMGRNFRTAANYIETEATDVGEREVHVRTRVADAFLSRVTDRSTVIVEYRQGLLEETVTLLGGTPTVEVSQVNIDRHEALYRITWQR